MSKNKLSIFSNLASDLPAGLVVFLVALPLCLGIALASEAPPIAGIIAGIIGGIVIGFVSGSHLSVSGPAAGLATIVASAITDLGSFEEFILSVAIAGVLQFVFGIVRLGIIGHYFPSAVIKGMLAGIGLTLVLKQIPHALGYDEDFEGELSFFQHDGENTFSEILKAINNLLNNAAGAYGAILIAVISLVILVFWQSNFMTKMKWTKIVPGALIVVLLGVFINNVLYPGQLSLFLSGNHLVKIDIINNASEISSFLTFPDFSQIGNSQVWITAITIAIVASLVSLLSLDAVDKLDPYKRIAPPNRELIAQGIGNFISGMIGGLPITAVIIRSSANVNSGAKTKVSAIVHGFLLLFSVLFLARYLNFIPKASLAAILLLVGFKLMRPSLIKSMWDKGWSQFVPFIVTITAIMATDILRGIIVGIIVGVFYVFRTNVRKAVDVEKKDDSNYILKIKKDASFINKASIRNKLGTIPDGAHVTFDLTKADFIDHDVVETLEDFKFTAKLRGISYDFIGADDIEISGGMSHKLTS